MKRTFSTGFDYQFSPADALHLNFRIHSLVVPDSELLRPSLNLMDVMIEPVTAFRWARRISALKIQTFNIAPTWTHTLSPNAVLT